MAGGYNTGAWWKKDQRFYERGHGRHVYMRGTKYRVGQHDGKWFVEVKRTEGWSKFTRPCDTRDSAVSLMTVNSGFDK